MKFWQEAEKRLSRWAVPGSVRYLVLLNALVYLLELMVPNYTAFLALVPELVMQGEVWRVFSWVFLPREMSPIWVLFALLFLWFLGDILESAWGAVRVNGFLILGWLGNTVAAFLFPEAGLAGAANLFLQLSLLFGACVAAPDYEILLFFVLPLRLKWIGIFSAALPVLLFLRFSWDGRLALMMGFLNLWVYWLYEIYSKSRENPRRWGLSLPRRKEEEEALHCCCVCKRTEKTNPELEFRVSADGQEYCMEHLPGKKKTDG